jgi:hypothetical protein
MAITDLTIFDEFLRTVVMGKQAQDTAKFNAATRGGIQLMAGSAMGSYKDTVFFKRIANLVRRRNVFGSGDVAETKLEDVVDTMVRVAAGTAPLDLSPSQFTWIGTNPGVAAAQFGKQLAEDTVEDMLNAAILAAVTALSATASNVHDYSGTGICSLAELNKGAAKFGDRAQAIRCWLMHSKTAHDIYGAAITNANNLFTSDTVNVVQDGFGRIFVVTDSPHLLDLTANPDKYFVLGLVEGGIIVRQNDDYDQQIVGVNGKENIKRSIQAEWSYNVGVKGYAWDKSTGGASPSDAAIGSSANWDQYGATAKDLPGVLVISQ